MKSKIALIITAALLITGCNITSADTGTAVRVDLSGVKESTYNITKGGTYTLTGSYKGMINVDTKDSVKLVLDNVNIENGTGPAIYGEDCSKLIIETAEGTENTFADGSEYTSDGKGCIFSNDDIVLQGSGVLNVNGAYDHGIISDDGVEIEGGSININSVGDGIHANNDITLKNGNMTVTSKQDGMQAEKNVNIEGGSIKITAVGEAAESTDNDPMDRGRMPFDGERPMGERPQMNGQMPKMPNGEMPEEFREHRKDMAAMNEAAAEITTSAKEPKENTTLSEAQTETTTEYPSSKGIKADGDITIKGGSIDISSNDHCIKSANITTVENGSLVLGSSKGKGIKAEGDLFINGGDMTITAKDEGLESKAIATINGGSINIKSEDDGINAGGGSGSMKMGNVEDADEHQVIINGGSVHIDAEGDGIDSNGNLSINGGTVNIDGPSNMGNGALDYGAKGSINGGNVIALGSAGMVQCAEEGKQNVFNITFDETQAAKTTVEVKDSKGNTIGNIVSAKQFQNMVFSSDNIKVGEAYTVYTNGSAAAKITAVKGVTSYGNSGKGFGRGGSRPNMDNMAK